MIYYSFNKKPATHLNDHLLESWKHSIANKISIQKSQKWNVASPNTISLIVYVLFMLYGTHFLTILFITSIQRREMHLLYRQERTYPTTSYAATNQMYNNRKCVIGTCPVFEERSWYSSDLTRDSSDLTRESSDLTQASNFL